MPYDFTPPPPSAFSTSWGKLSKTQAIVLFKAATGETVGTCHHFLVRNLGDYPAYEVQDVGKLLLEYYEQKADRRKRLDALQGIPNAAWIQAALGTFPVQSLRAYSISENDMDHFQMKAKRIRRMKQKQKARQAAYNRGKK